MACKCWRCLEERDEIDPRTGWPTRFSFFHTCDKCGNKRCPHGTDHRLACTNSNEPGQPGSRFTPTPSPSVR